jgi:death-on-curing protein
MTSGEPMFLTYEDIVEFHAQQLELFGGSAGVRDDGVLRAAIAMPESTFDGVYLHGDLFAMAAAYAFHIAEGQPFLDGNKRTGLNAALVFLELNGWTIDDPGTALYEAIIGLATGAQSKSGLAQLFRELASPVLE